MEDLGLFTEIGLPKQHIIESPKKIYDYGSLLLTSVVQKDEYTQYIEEHFDLKIEDTCSIAIPNKIKLEKLKHWNIGVICGASGSGKSTILKNIGNGSISHASFDISKPIISNFENLTPQEAAEILSSMGLASVPSWIRPYNVLSNGEKYRAELAKIVSESQDEIILIDEYTSVVDRNVAKAMSNALQKYIRKHNKRIILATCHYDILEWLRPDWIYDLNKGGTLEESDCRRQSRPKIELQVFRTTIDTWERFKKYHYMTEDLNKSSSCFVFTWDEKCVCFYSLLPLPSGTIKNGYRGHRLVVLPDYQGFGLGSKISEFMGGILKNENKILYTKTVNPALGEYREKSEKWEGTPRNRQGMNESDFLNNILGGKTRVSYCHKYIGESIEGYENLLKPIEDIRQELSNKYQLAFDL